MKCVHCGISIEEDPREGLPPYRHLSRPLYNHCHYASWAVYGGVSDNIAPGLLATPPVDHEKVLLDLDEIDRVLITSHP